MTATQAKWAERVREWRASGQTAEQFADGRGFEASTLRYWSSRLRVNAPKDAAAAAPQEPSADAPSVRVVRVRRTRAGVTSRTASGSVATRSNTSSAPIVIAIGAARIEVASGFERSLLHDIVEVLGGVR